MHDDLDERAQRLGIQLSYRDAAGNERRIDDAILPVIIDALTANGAKHTSDSYNSTRVEQRAFQPTFATLGQRCWLLAIQLYSLQTPGNWGHGDFSDLAKLMEIVAAAGGDGIGLNPLHALFEDRPDDPSPYAPSSRRFLNPLYLDIAAVPGFAEADREEYRPNTPCDGGLIDYAAVAVAKYAALRSAHRRFRDSPSTECAAAFAAYRRDTGQALRRFGVFTNLRRLHGPNWHDWPIPWREVDDGAIDAFAGQDETEVDFQEFLQWQAHEQLSRCKARAQQLGLRIGLYMDLAVGVHPHGFDAWNDQIGFLQDIAIGAPPDPLNQAGQNWGLTAFNPSTLVQRDFAHFHEMLAATMQYAGAIRFDHILGLSRLYLIPTDRSERSGAYVTLPLIGLLDALAAESHRHNCLVIGEDLGTVPDGFRDALREAGIWTFLVMLFSRNADGAFLPPETYTPEGLALFGTHDLPTLAGWLTRRDLAVLHELAIPVAETADQRNAAILALDQALDDAGIPQGDACERVTRFLALTPSGVLSISIEDVLGIVEQVNLPGTDKEYPNWRRCLALSLDDLAGKLTALGQKLAADGRGSL